MNSESVWCVPRTLWEKHGNFEGFQEDSNKRIYDVLLKNGKFIPRHLAENDDRFKQVIPQALLRFKEQVFVNQRLPKQSDSRLLYAYSLGVGGHLNVEDVGLGKCDIIESGLKREMFEEVHFKEPYTTRFIGITNDEQSEVSKVHIGVWFEIRLQSSEVKVLETEKIKGEWATMPDLHQLEPQLESWARFVFQQYLSKFSSINA